MRNHFRPQKSFMRESRAHNSWSGLFDHFEEAGRNFRRVFSKKKKINSCNVSKRRRIKKLDQWNWSNFDPVWKHPLNTSRTFFLALLQNSLESLFRNDSTFHTRTIPTLASSSFLLFFSLLRLQIHSWIPHHPPPTFKDSCGGMGGLQMVVFYGFTLFTNWFLAMWNKNRCLPPVEPPTARQKRVEKSVERGRTSYRKTNDSRRIVRRIYASHTCPRHS